MEVVKFDIEGVLLFKAQVFQDDRGYFFEAFSQKKFSAYVEEPINFVQDNQSLSQKGTVRGLHFQKPPHAQGKLVNVVTGAVVDLIVDIRSGSKTYGQSLEVSLFGDKAEFLWVPAGFAHGFYTKEDQTIFQYKCSNYYNRESEGSLAWNDPAFGFEKIVENNPIVSDKDQIAPLFKDFNSPF